MKTSNVWKGRFAAATGLMIAAALLPGCGAGPGNGDDPLTTYKIQRGPLVIDVTESGTIMSRDRVVILCEVPGQSTILSVVPEGTTVAKGDLLIELDRKTLEDARFDQRLKVQNAEAAFVRARETLAITKSKAESETEKAKLTLQFAELDLKKFKEGEYPKDLNEAEAGITLAEEDLHRATEKQKWSKILFQEKYISQTELEADELAVKKATLDVQLARGKLDLLKNYTSIRRTAETESDVRQATAALERAQRENAANILQAEADLTAKESEFSRQTDRLKDIDGQIAKTRIYAPNDGQVIYATSMQQNRWGNSGQPLEAGQQVRERQELIHLPQATHKKVEIKIHESSLQKVHVDMPVVITVDALPGRTFSGRVSTIAPVPDSGSSWMNPDLKVYETDVLIDGDGSELRSGMTCKAQIVVESHDSVLAVPVQCVVKVDEKTCVYLLERGQRIRRDVTVGLDNNRMVRIVDGLREGDQVVMNPPLAQTESKVAAVKPPAGSGAPPAAAPAADGKRPGPALRSGGEAGPRDGATGGRPERRKRNHDG